MKNNVMKERGVDMTFHRVTPDDIPTLMKYMPMACSRTCDFSIGGITMWADYFSYEMAEYNDTLFLKGVCEDDLSRTAFSMPVGKMSPKEAVEILDTYCRAEGIPLVLSAVPEDYLESLAGMRFSVDELVDWADYVYRIEDLATLSGKRYGRKRNHVNRFITDNPDYSYEPLTLSNVAEVKDFYLKLDNHDGTGSPTAAVEREQVFGVLDHLAEYPFEGGVLRRAPGEIVAFTLGEVIGDTLYVHIEKMSHDVAGAGETINKCFAEDMYHRHADLVWVNREEDVGDEGLRKAKESYRPAMKLRKYNLVFSPVINGEVTVPEPEYRLAERRTTDAVQPARALVAARVQAAERA
ncbi:MAG: phosphatidylglycerol lysyltransferase domain-containing protein [Muribaculum sp.]|nr:phosphatidylglycerol lysyltransferase domain-containing protein [Muribaculum sp.]